MQLKHAGEHRRIPKRRDDRGALPPRLGWVRIGLLILKAHGPHRSIRRGRLGAFRTARLGSQGLELVPGMDGQGHPGIRNDIRSGFANGCG